MVKPSTVILSTLINFTFYLSTVSTMPTSSDFLKSDDNSKEQLQPIIKGSISHEAMSHNKISNRHLQPTLSKDFPNGDIPDNKSNNRQLQQILSELFPHEEISDGSTNRELQIANRMIPEDEIGNKQLAIRMTPDNKISSRQLQLTTTAGTITFIPLFALLAATAQSLTNRAGAVRIAITNTLQKQTQG